MSSIFAIIFSLTFVPLLWLLNKPSFMVKGIGNLSRQKILRFLGLSATLFFILTTISIKLDNVERAKERENKISVNEKIILPAIEKREEPEKGTMPDDKTGIVETAIVNAVIDGDTVVINDDRHVRLLAIDASERGEACYLEAGERLRDLVLGKSVELISDTRNADKYGRLLRFILIDGKNINLQMVVEGLAKCYSFAEDTLYIQDCIEAQAQAEKENNGCLYREQESVSTYADDCVIKGNISFTSNEKIYHIPGCDNYSDTEIDESRGERWFCSEEEAVADGWRKDRNCP